MACCQAVGHNEVKRSHIGQNIGQTPENGHILMFLTCWGISKVKVLTYCNLFEHMFIDKKHNHGFQKVKMLWQSIQEVWIWAHIGHDMQFHIIAVLKSPTILPSNSKINLFYIMIYHKLVHTYMYLTKKKQLSGPGIILIPNRKT